MASVCLWMGDGGEEGRVLRENAAVVGAVRVLMRPASSVVTTHTGGIVCKVCLAVRTVITRHACE